MKKFFSYNVCLAIFLSFIILILYGSLLRHHYLKNDNSKFVNLKKGAVFLAEIPFLLKSMITSKTINIDEARLRPQKNKDKKKFVRFQNNKRNALLVLPRYDHNLDKSIIEVLDMNDYKVIHRYEHDMNVMIGEANSSDEITDFRIVESDVLLSHNHPIVLADGSFISQHQRVYKVDVCSNLIWMSEDYYAHHSLMIDHEDNIFTGGQAKPKSNYLKKYNIENYIDDSILKLNSYGKVIYNKSITDILIKNEIFPDNIVLVSSSQKQSDPIHVNDIEPALNNTEYWKQGDLFLSLRHLSSIVHYRPKTNKVINYITGPFSYNHDVDIISDEEISIFNNNNFGKESKYSEIVVYNFKTKKFSKLFNDQLKKSKFKTETQGLSHTFKDGSLLVDEQNFGRLILYNSNGEIEWEFVNKDINEKIGFIFWPRIIEDEAIINKFKLSVKDKKC